MCPDGGEKKAVMQVFCIDGLHSWLSVLQMNKAGFKDRQTLGGPDIR